MPNAFIEWYLENQYNNNLSSIMDKDYELKQYPLNYSYQDLVHTNGFLDYSKDILGLSGEDMVKYLSDNRLSNIMFGTYNQNNTRRNDWINHFEKALYNNIDLYKQCIKVCLNEHLRKTKVNTEDPIILQHIEQFKEDNRKLFEKLVIIGKMANHFNPLLSNSIKNDELLTENREYQLFLEQQNVFDSELKLDKFLEVYNAQKEDTMKKFISVSRDSLYKELLKDSTLITTLSNIDQGLSSRDVFNNFINILIENKFGLNDDSHNEFMRQLLKNPVVYQSALRNKNFKSLLDKSPQVFVELLENFNETQKGDFYYTKYSYEHSASPSSYGASNSSAIIKHMLKEITNLDYYQIEIFNKVYDNTINYTFMDSEPINKRIEFNNFLAKNVFDFNTTFKSYASTEQNLFRQALLEKYVPIITDNFNINSEVTIGISNHTAEIVKLKENIELLPSHLQSKQIKKLSNKVQMQVYHYFTKDNSDLYGTTFSNGYNNRIIERLPIFLSNFDNYEVLDVLNADNNNPLWKSIKLNITDSYKNLKKQTKYSYYNDMPLAFYLIEKTSGAALNWFINEQNLQHFADLKYDNKNVLGYFKKNETVFQQMVLQILQSEEAFNTLIKPNKTILKNVSEIDNHEIQSGVKYYLLNDKVNKKVKKDLEQMPEVKKNKL